MPTNLKHLRNLALAALTVASSTVARGETILGTCYRYLHGYKPQAVVEVFGENHVVQKALHAGRTYEAAGTYTSNVALQNDLIVMGDEPAHIRFTLARPTRSSWISSWLALEFYEWKDGRNQLVSSEQVECFDAGTSASFQPFLLEAEGIIRWHGWPPPELHDDDAIALADQQALTNCQAARDGTGSVQRLGYAKVNLDYSAHQLVAQGTYRCF